MELIKITEQNGQKVVDARLLHEFLVINAKGGQKGEDFTNWIKRNLEYLDAKLNIDYTILEYDYKGNDITNFSESVNQSVTVYRVHKREYAITINLAKQISMVQNNDKGKEARQYFIECENKINKPMSQIDLIIQSAQMLKDIETKQYQIEQRLTAIESKPQINAPIEHFSIMGYCHNIKKQISLEQAKQYGVKCRRMCNELGLVIGKVSDPRFGSVNTYPFDVLKEIIL